MALICEFWITKFRDSFPYVQSMILVFCSCMTFKSTSIFFLLVLSAYADGHALRTRVYYNIYDVSIPTNDIFLMAMQQLSHLSNCKF